MPLRNKYIKYTSDITYEVFEKLWNLLYDKGWESHDCSNCREQYREFSGLFPILQAIDTNNKVFMASNKIIINNTECKITDLLNSPPVSSLDNTPASLLEKARRNYPDKVRFRSPENGELYTVKLNGIVNDYWGSMHPKGVLVQTEGCGQYVYFNNKWAEIVSTDSTNSSTPISRKLTEDDLIYDEYYAYHLSNSIIIFQFEGENYRCKHLTIESKSINNTFKDDSWEYNCGKLEKASADQIAHFKKCRAVDKYVDADGIDNKFYYLKKGDKVKLLISSSYRGVIYNEGEVWEVIEDCEHEHNHIYVTRNDQKTTLYSFECKKVNDKEPNVKPILSEPGILGGITHKLLPVPEVNEIPDISNYFPVIKELIFN